MEKQLSDIFCAIKCKTVFFKVHFCLGSMVITQAFSYLNFIKSCYLFYGHSIIRDFFSCKYCCWENSAPCNGKCQYSRFLTLYIISV